MSAAPTSSNLDNAVQDADRLPSGDVDGSTVDCGPQKTYIGIRLIDEDGNPVNGQSYRLGPAGGSLSGGELDDSGEYWLRNIDPGQYSVDFPGIDKRQWPAAPAI